MLVEAIEARLPLVLLLADPAGEVLHAFDVQAARSPLPVHALVDQAAPPKDAHVAGDRLVREIERRGQLADGCLALSEASDDRSARLIAQGGERGVQFCLDVGWRGHGDEASCN